MEPRYLPFVLSWFRGFACVLALTVPAAAQSAAGKPTTYKGLEISVAGIERASTASLNDCPPGENRVVATTRPGEEFAIVKVSFKVLPAFQPTPLKRPAITDASGKSYFTAVSFVDVGKTPEFSCAIPFRVPAGTALKSLQIDSATLDLSSADTKKH